MSKVITSAELQSRSAAALRAVFNQAQRELAASAAGSAARRNALASLENISRALRARLSAGPRP